MSAVATSERAVRAPARPARRLFEPEPGRISLEDAILRISEQLAGDGHAACPVCAHRIDADSPCESCGSELS
jgi:hypothetical protein